MASLLNANRLLAPVTHLVNGLVSLIAAEVVCMVLVLPWVLRDQGAVVLMGLLALPLWACFLTLVYTAEKRLRVLLVLVAVILVGGLVLRVFS